MSKFKSSNESIFIASSKLAQGFTVIPNEIMNDMKLMGPDAYFVFGKILQYITNPDHKITIQGLSTQLGVSKTRVSNGLNKLIEIGYIKRTPLKNGNLTNGYLYEVFSEKQNVDITNVNDNVNTNVSEKTNNDESVENTTSHRNPKNWDTENRDTNFCDTDFRYANKENNNNNYINKENEVVVGVEKETKLIELYKSFKIEKRFMPHTKKLLLEYANKFDLDVFEQVFIAASEESVSKKYAYMKQVFENLDKKNIVTLDDYQKDQAEFKNKKQNKKDKGKTVTKDTGKENKKPLTKYHDTFNEHYKNYTSDELDDKLRQSKSNNNNNLEEQLYLAAVENGFNSLSDLSQSRVLHYATENNLDIPK
jgi:predicted transcriptional regulator